MDYYLLRRGGYVDPLRINLNESEVTVGSNCFSELHKSPLISHKHASFKTSNGDWFVTDLNSSSGVYVNGVRVKQPLHRLRLGDCIGLGVSRAISSKDFEFELCRISLKVKSEVHDIITLTDSEMSDAEDNNANEVHEEENVEFRLSSIVSGAQVQNESSSSFDSNSSDSNLSNSNESRNSYEHVYAQMLKNQPVVLLTRCDSEVLSYSRKFLSDEKLLKERKRILQSDFSSSESEESISSRKKKSKLPVEKQKVLYNVFSSDTSDEEDLDKLFTSTHAPKNTPNKKQQGKTCAIIDKPAYRKKSSIQNNGEFSTSLNSNENNMTLPPSAGFRKSISAGNKNLHSRSRDNECGSIAKGKIEVSTDFKEIKRTRFPSKSSNAPVDQVSGSHKVKMENDSINSKGNSEVPKLNFFTVKVKAKVSITVGKTETPSVVVKTKVNQEDDDGANSDDYLAGNKEITTDVPAYNEVNCNKDTCINDNEIEKPDLEEENEEPYSENIDATKSSLEKEDIVRKYVTTNQSGSKKVYIKIKAAAQKVEDDENSYLSNLSQHFFTGDEALHSKKFAGKSRENDYRENRLEVGSSEVRKNKHATAMLIEPQPMKYRPRYQRGREEWFSDEHYEKPDTARNEKVPKQSNETSKMKKAKGILIDSKLKNDAIMKKKPIKEKIEEQMGHRIRAPNDGSAIRPVSDQPAHKLKRCSDIMTADISIKKQKFSAPSNENSTSKQNVRKEKLSSETASKNRNIFKSREQFQTVTTSRLRQNSDKSKQMGYKIPKAKPNSKRTPLLNKKLDENIKADEKKAIKRLPRLDFDSVLSVILNWNPRWLKEYKAKKEPPKDITQDLRPLPSSFESFDEYVGRFYPIILLELWEYIFKEYTEIENAPRDKDEANVISMIITKCISTGDIMVLNCESLVSVNSEFYPREGKLVIIDLFDEGHDNEVLKIFGYISHYKYEKSDSRHLHREFFQRPDVETGHFHLYEFSLKIRKLKLKPKLEKLTKVWVLCYVANKIRLADGLQYFLTCPLKHDILKPSERTLRCLPRNAQLSKNIHGSYNQNQTTAIVNMTAEMKAADCKCKMILLQSPPGTGKTHTITGLIENLILDEDVKILVTAPSNTAVDEVGKQLIHRRKHYPDKTLRIVRVGLLQQIHKDLQPYTLENLTGEYAGQNTKNHLGRLKKSSSGQAIRTNKKAVLEKANIILLSLDSCRLRILETVFGKHSTTPFTCCIVDEAAQCTEPEIMQLFVFGLSKFVLVGDHRQLPAPVYSNLAIKMNYNISLFERIHSHFQKQHLPSPSLLLTEQYYMHSDICAFPSSHFYSNRLCTYSNLDRTYTNSFPLKPFVILDVNDSRESNAQPSKQNFPEADIIFRICEHLREMRYLNYSVGIITPCRDQKEFIFRKLNGKGHFRNIEVNTVDSFQRKEKDIIILFCVRGRSQDESISFMECSKRLNVALTRARQCLIICGHMKSLYDHPDWKALIINSEERQLYITITSKKDIPFFISKKEKKQR